MSPRSTATNNCPLCGNIDALDAVSPSPELFASNSPPSESEAKTFQSTRARARLRVDLLTEQISAMQKTLQGLIYEKDALKTKIVEYDVVLHPVRSAPVDILTRVFLACLDESIQATDRPISPDPRNAPWTLSQVSSRWRTMSLSFPRLWSCIVIKFDARPSRLNDPRKVAGCLIRQLQRSAAHPLIVVIASDIPPQHALIPIMLSHSSRWKQLSFMISLPNLRSFAPISGCLHSLQLLYLFTENARSPPTTLDMIHSSTELEFPIRTMFQFTPQLRVVVGDKPASLLAFELPWSHIRHFESFDSSVRLMELLRRASNTESIISHRLGRGGGGEALPADSPVELPRLRAIKLVDDIWFSVGHPQVLAHIRTPSLETLDFTGWDSSIADSLQTLIEVSHPPITILKIHSFYFSDDHCIATVKNIPALRSLSLNVFTCSSKFKNILTDTPSLAPLLELLEIDTTYARLIGRSPEQKVSTDMRSWEGLRASRPGLKIRLWKKTGAQVV